MTRTMKILFMLFLLPLTSCDTILGWGEKSGYDYKNVNFHSGSYIGGFTVYYEKRSGGSVFLGFDSKISGSWVDEGEEFKKYSYKTSSWFDWHIKKVTDSFVEIGVRER